MSPLLLIIVVIVVVILIVIFLLKKSNTLELPFELPLGRKKPFPDLKQHPHTACPRNPRTIELPLRFDPNLGVYMTKIRLGDGQSNRFIDVTPDTGSSILTVAAENCQGCDLKGGSWPSTAGQDMSNGQLGYIRYGGQQMTIYKPYRARFYDDDADDTTGFEVDFALAQKTSSPDGKPLNVLGLQSGPQTFLEGLCGARVVTLDFAGGKLILGNTNATVERKAYVGKLSSSPTLIKFNLYQVLSMKVNGQSIPASVMPTSLVIDSGATQTIVDQSLMKYLQPGQVEITVAGINGEPISIPFKNRSGTVSVDRVPFTGAMVIGNRWLQDFGLQLNYDQGTMTLFQ